MAVLLQSPRDLAARAAATMGRHMPVLDGLRGLAIALVLAHNVGTAQPRGPTLWHKLLYPLHMPGWVGVHLFFVLSGFLITGILLDGKARVGRLEFFRSFHVRRTLRIFPLYYAALAICFLIGPALAPATVAETPASTQVWYWAYLSNWVSPYGFEVKALSHFWSLALEEQFYFVWPLMVMLTSRRGLVCSCVGMAVVALGVRLWLVAHDAPTLAPYQLTAARMDALVLGSVAAIAARTPALFARVVPHLGRAVLVCGAAILAMVPFSRGLSWNASLMQTLGHSVIALFFTLLLLLAVIAEINQSRLARTLSHPALRWLGRHSYAIYVVHIGVASALRPIFQPHVRSPSFAVAAAGLLGYIAAVALGSMAIALVSWHLLEQRCLALKDVLAPRPRVAADPWSGPV